MLLRLPAWGTTKRSTRKRSCPRSVSSRLIDPANTLGKASPPMSVERPEISATNAVLEPFATPVFLPKGALATAFKSTASLSTSGDVRVVQFSSLYFVASATTCTSGSSVPRSSDGVSGPVVPRSLSASGGADPGM